MPLRYNDTDRKPENMEVSIMDAKALGNYIVADPEICHGAPTFRGTRIMVWQILEQVAKGRPWDDIVQVWGGKVSKDAIAEALHLTSFTLRERGPEYLVEPTPA